jgi:hypothetical protein
MFYGFARGKTKLNEQQKVHASVAFGIGATLLIALAEVLPEIGVPLAVLFLVSVAVAQTAAVNWLANFVSTANKGAAGQSNTGRAASGIIGI